MLAGAPLTLHCDYTLSTSVDISIETVVTWMVNGSTVATSGERSITGVALTFSLLTTSDTGRYTCTLAITAPQTPFVTVESPKESPEKIVTAQSE